MYVSLWPTVTADRLRKVLSKRSSSVCSPQKSAAVFQLRLLDVGHSLEIALRMVGEKDQTPNVLSLPIPSKLKANDSLAQEYAMTLYFDEDCKVHMREPDARSGVR